MLHIPVKIQTYVHCRRADVLMFLGLEFHVNMEHCGINQVIIKLADRLRVFFCIKFQFSSAYFVV